MLSTESPAQTRLRAHFVTLFPDFFRSVLQSSILGRAQAAGLVECHLHDIREATADRHRTADDTPFGGGAGMVMKPEPIVATLERLAAEHGTAHRVLLSAAGARFDQAKARELAGYDAIAFVCGHYEGVDERVVEGWIDEELSIGDFVLTGGEPAALVVFDAILRLRAGVLGNEASSEDESFSTRGLLEYPQYTRPAEFRGRWVLEVLRSGHHGAVASWRRQQSLLRTARRRPESLVSLLGELTRAELEGLHEGLGADHPLAAKLLDALANLPPPRKRRKKQVDSASKALQNHPSVGLRDEESHDEQPTD